MDKIIQANENNDLKFRESMMSEEEKKKKDKKDKKDKQITESANQDTPLQYFTE